MKMVVKIDIEQIKLVNICVKSFPFITDTSKIFIINKQYVDDFSVVVTAH